MFFTANSNNSNISWSPVMLVMTAVLFQQSVQNKIVH